MSQADGGERFRADALVKLLEQLRAYVQTIADADLERAATLIQSAAMNVKRLTLRAKRVFAVHQGAVSGAVTLVTASGGHRASYEWQLSAQGQRLRHGVAGGSDVRVPIADGDHGRRGGLESADHEDRAVR
jgi:hypothetical protein